MYRSRYDSLNLLKEEPLIGLFVTDSLKNFGFIGYDFSKAKEKMDKMLIDKVFNYELSERVLSERVG